MVTPEAPVKAVRKVQTTIPTMARPPGIQPNAARVMRNRRSEARLPART